MDVADLPHSSAIGSTSYERAPDKRRKRPVSLSSGSQRLPLRDDEGRYHAEISLTLNATTLVGSLPRWSTTSDWFPRAPTVGDERWKPVGMASHLELSASP